MVFSQRELATVLAALRFWCRRRSNIDQVYRLNFDQGR